MKKIIYLLAVALVFSSFTFKTVVKNVETAKRQVALKKQSVKKKNFTNVNINYYNPVFGADYHVTLTNEATHIAYTFDIPVGTDGNLGSVPTGNYDIDIWSTSDTHSYLLLIGSPVEGTLGGYGPVMHDINIPVYYDETVSITN